MLKNLKAEPLEFFTSIRFSKYQKIEGDSADIKNFSAKSLTQPEKGESHGAETSEKGTLPLCHGFVFHVGDIKSVQNQQLYTCGKENILYKKWTIQSETDKKTYHCKSRAFFLKGKCAD